MSMERASRDLGNDDITLSSSHGIPGDFYDTQSLIVGKASDSESVTLYDRSSVESARSDSPTLYGAPVASYIPPAFNYTPVNRRSGKKYKRACSDFFGNAFPVFAFLACHAIYAVWLAFYLKIYVHPVPRSPLNKTKSGYYAYQIVLDLIATCLGFIDIFLVYYFTCMVWDIRRQVNLLVMSLLLGFCLCAALASIVIVGGGPWFLAYILQSVAWSHGCDAYPMYAVLESDGTNTAHFYAAGGHPLFTYTLASPPGTQLITFNLTEWDTNQTSIFPSSYPALQHIAYDLTDYTITGDCTVPGSTPAPCVSGTFTKYSYLPANMTSSVPLADTSQFLTPPMALSLRAEPAEMFFVSWADAALILRQDNSAGDVGPEILRTGPHKLYHCRELKVCVNGVPDRGLVGAEVLVPLGFIFQQHAQYASWCHKYRPSTGTGPDP